VLAPALAQWLRARLTGPQAAGEWKSLLEAGFEAALDQPLAQLIAPEALEKAVLAHLDEARLVELYRFGIRGALAEVLVEAQQDAQPLGRWWSAEGKEKVRALVGRPGWIQSAWIEQLVEQKAAEELLSDTLYHALRDFSTLVPRLLQSLTPSALGKFAKLGGSLGGKIFDDVEKRLEPEIRRFLELGTQKALVGAATFAKAGIDGPLAIEARKNLASFFLEQSPKFHTMPMNAEVLAALEAVVEDLAQTIARAPESRQRAHAVIQRLANAHGHKATRDFLAERGLVTKPPYEEWAALTWPAVLAILRAPAVDQWLVQLANELVAAWDGSNG